MGRGMLVRSRVADERNDLDNPTRKIALHIQDAVVRWLSHEPHEPRQVGVAPFFLHCRVASDLQGRNAPSRSLASVRISHTVSVNVYRGGCESSRVGRRIRVANLAKNNRTGGAGCPMFTCTRAEAHRSKSQLLFNAGSRGQTKQTPQRF
jgi:hypothetical protein